MIRTSSIALALAAVLLAISVAGRSLHQDNPLSNPSGGIGRFSQNLSQDSEEPAETISETTTTTDANANANADSSVSSSTEQPTWTPPPMSHNHTWPGHNYTAPTNVTIEIEIKKEEEEKEEKEEEEEKIPECTDAAASCCHQTINVIPVDEHTNVPLPGQKCTYSETITTVITPACADIHCWHGCSHCSEKAVVETSTVKLTMDLLVSPYPPAIWAVKEKAKCFCPKPVEQKVTVTATASASASDTHH